MCCLLKVGKKIISRACQSMRNLLRFVKSCKNSDKDTCQNGKWRMNKKKTYYKMIQFYNIYSRANNSFFLHKQVEWFTGFFQIDEAKKCFFFLFLGCVW